MSAKFTQTEVEAYLAAVPAEASEARRWQAVKTATQRMMRTHGMTDAGKWKIGPLTGHGPKTYGMCYVWARVIRYRPELVREWWTDTLAATITHEVAHAVTAHELRLQGKTGDGGHGPMWRGTAAALGLREARARNLPGPQRAVAGGGA